MPTIPHCLCIQPPTGEYRWKNYTLQSRIDTRELTLAELNANRLVTESECKMEMLKIPIPAPSCSTIPPPDCSMHTNPFTRTACENQRELNGIQSKQKCDYSSVNLAKKNQKEFFTACMGAKGWQKVWHEYPLVEN